MSISNQHAADTIATLFRIVQELKGTEDKGESVDDESTTKKQAATVRMVK
jgi:hypothetical protein